MTPHRHTSWSPKAHAVVEMHDAVGESSLAAPSNRLVSSSMTPSREVIAVEPGVASVRPGWRPQDQTIPRSRARRWPVARWRPAEGSAVTRRPLTPHPAVRSHQAAAGRVPQCRPPVPRRPPICTWVGMEMSEVRPRRSDCSSSTSRRRAGCPNMSSRVCWWAGCSSSGVAVTRLGGEHEQSGVLMDRSLIVDADAAVSRVTPGTARDAWSCQRCGTRGRPGIIVGRAELVRRAVPWQ